MTLKWRKDTEHAVLDALSRLPQKGPARSPIDTSFPDYIPCTCRGFDSLYARHAAAAV